MVFCHSSLTMGQNSVLLRQEEVALSYVLWYSVGRFFIEGMRTNSLWIGKWIRVSQALSLPLFIGAIVVWFIRRQDYPPISYYSDGNKGQKKTIKMVN
ncbi:prolipoprotein diacylglyceryl transferase family protein [Aerococcus viridans]|nr:prolipoprotein diacylglyceryl transferase family protein [Aerococcus viridans]